MRILIWCLTIMAFCACGGVASYEVHPCVCRLPLRVAIVGDSISKLQILPDSPVPCGLPSGFATTCDYSTDGSHSYPTLLAQQMGYHITNLAVPGARTVQPFPGTTPVINQVPGIPPNTQVVILESGTNDTSANGAGPEYLAWIEQVVTAIKTQAPQATLVFVGVRYYYGSDQTRVDLWNTDLQSQSGSFVEMRTAWPSVVSTYWPDGTHPGQPAVYTMAQTIGQLLNALPIAM